MTGLAKVNVLAVGKTHVLVGGLDSGNKGIFALMELPLPEEEPSTEGVMSSQAGEGGS